MNKFDEAIQNAQFEKYTIENLISAEISAATLEIRSKHAPSLREASTALFNAEEAKRQHIDANASHDWDGKKVFMIEKTYSRWSSALTGEVRTEGIVEVVRTKSEFPDNMRWSLPRLGDVIVRKVKKDGTPSKQFHDKRGKLESIWTLSE